MNKQRRTRLLTLHARFSSLCDELEPICEEEQTAADALTEYFETVQADDAPQWAIGVNTVTIPLEAQSAIR